MSPAARNVVFFDDAPNADANEAVAGLSRGGYNVLRASDATVFEHLVQEHGPEGSNSLAAVVVDVSENDHQSMPILARISGDPALLQIPKVHLIRPDQAVPTGDLTLALKRPVAAPALLRLLEHMQRPQTGAHTAAMPRCAGRRIGPYEVITEIASGGMGTVYLAQRTNEVGFRRLHAVKVLHEHLANDGDLHAMVLDEAELASRIHHPNVAAVVDLGLEAARPYVVMEYVEGCSFAQLLGARHVAPRIDRIIRVILDVLEGLQAAHDVVDDDGSPLGIVHRDVSPDNVLVGCDGIARLTDFGVAKAHNRLSSTQKGVHKGKLLYLAPEQLLEPEKIDHRVDVFAVGTMLWSALTGRNLFGAESPAAILHNLISADIAPPSTVNEMLPRELDAICLRALSRDPAGRYPSARDMSRDLRSVARNLGVLVPPEAVADWVAAAHGEALAQRRRTVQHARSGEPAPTVVSELPTRRLGTVSAATQISASAPVPAATPLPTTTPIPTAMASSAPRGWLFAALGLGLAGVAVAALLVTNCGGPPETEDGAQPAAADDPDAGHAQVPAGARAHGAADDDAAATPEDSNLAQPDAGSQSQPATVLKDAPPPEPEPDSATKDAAGSAAPAVEEPPEPRARTPRRHRRTKKRAEATTAKPVPDVDTLPPPPAKATRRPNPLHDGPESNPYQGKRCRPSCEPSLSLPRCAPARRSTSRSTSTTSPETPPTSSLTSASLARSPW